LLAVAASFEGRDGAVYHGNGDFDSNDGHLWQTKRMTDGEAVEISPDGGRPCDGAFPYGGSRVARAMVRSVQSGKRVHRSTGGTAADQHTAAAGGDYPHAEHYVDGLGRR
jgi:hypothetical protein